MCQELAAGKREGLPTGKAGSGERVPAAEDGQAWVDLVEYGWGEAIRGGETPANKLAPDIRKFISGANH